MADDPFVQLDAFADQLRIAAQANSMEQVADPLFERFALRDAVDPERFSNDLKHGQARIESAMCSLR
jgi:hypothetical protein